MLERPALADEAIVGLVRDRYGMMVGELAFLPIGNDAATWLYRLHKEEGAVIC